ncbi:hypothetical protein D9613_000299 [Agrocybe pediades]|uniref:Bms1-type G domain-containing protein n=1 Tax=Agrocybe pediades TaxID=84607 RepID=A0A8H4QZR9_9AGAR|nr:hypothetical protein D9613_000299 [Agrocybe pediades]
MVEGQHHHRPTLKQQNKPFKSKHATKGSLKEAAKGKIARQSPKASPASSAAAQSRLNRRNNAKQAQATKRNALISATRIFSGVDGAPRIVAVIPLTYDVSAKSTVKSLAESLDIEADDCPEDGIWKMRADRFKTSLQFRTVPYRSFYAALDACKVADYVVFVLSSSVEVDTWGDTLLRTLQAQGLPEVVSVVSPDASIDAKSRPGILKSLLSFVRYFVPTQTRVFDLHVASEKLNALRSLAEGKPTDVRWKEGRSWLLGESAEWEGGTLKVTGVVRGMQLSANRLVHLPNVGDFQISKILSAPLPRQAKSGQVTMEVEPTVVAEPDADEQDSLVSSNDPEDFGNEQTWPTEEEMNGAVDDVQQEIPDAKVGTTPKAVRRIPKGMSEYQAAWIIDDDEEEEGDKSQQSGDEVDMGGAVEDEEEEMEDMVMDDAQTEMGDRGVRFEDLDMEDEEEQLQEWRNRKREEEDDLSFPDEVDTPKEIPARTRFQRYRGLRSFRTSPWDPYENLPRDYARIFQFEDFKRTERSVRRRAEEELNAVQPGTRVSIYLKDVPQEAASTSPTVLFSVLQHEHKVTVTNFTVQRNTEYDGSVRSKDPLILCVGPRRLAVNPIYSQHTRGGGKGANNVHKFERYLRHGLTSVATIYGPVVYAPHLVASGTFLNPDTTRVIAKRIILTGHPFKVHKKTATIRYMFFNPVPSNSSLLFPTPAARFGLLLRSVALRALFFYYLHDFADLHTKHGRTGHIRESLGTHGYFKAYFDGPINQMDTVCMSLYKRVFPKWATLWTQKNSGAKQNGNGGGAPAPDAMEE